jgi:hypothetical protein
MKKIIYHPKCKELFGTIEKLDLTKKEYEGYELAYETIDSMGWEDWCETYEEAEKSLLISLENHYNGSTLRGIAEENRYAAEERFATSGGY